MCPLSFSSIRYLVNHYFKLPLSRKGIKGIYLFYTNILIDILSISKLFDGDIFSMVLEFDSLLKRRERTFPSFVRRDLKGELLIPQRRA